MPSLERTGPRWTGILARIFAFTFFSTLLAFAIALLLSLLGTVVHARIKHVPPDLMFAYKHIAFPIAISVGTVVLILTVTLEIRNYRQGKVLAAIERATLNH